MTLKLIHDPEPPHECELPDRNSAYNNIKYADGMIVECDCGQNYKCATLTGFERNLEWKRISKRKLRRILAKKDLAMNEADNDQS